MKQATLERVIGQSFTYARDHVPGRLVSFIWHGGEPTIAGLDFYKRVADLQESECQGAKYNNSLQTNGTLLNEEWLPFLKNHEYTVSISIDGPAELHDRNRVDRRGRGSFSRVLAAIQRVKEAEIPLGVCVVISRANLHRVDEIYDFLANEKLRFNVIPLNRSGAARENYEDVGLFANEYADAWIKMYDRWFDASDRDYVYCSDFVFKTRAIIAGRPADCIALEQCSDTNISVDPVGDVYPCATLSGSDDTRYGNLVDASLDWVMKSRIANNYRHRKMDPQCQQCRWQHVCHGGCQARAYKFFGDNNQRDYYCPSLFRIYEHVAKRVRNRFDLPWDPMQPVHDNRELASAMTRSGASVSLQLRRMRNGEPVVVR